MAGLIFFLNPHLRFAPLPLLRAMAFYVGVLSVLSLAVQMPFTWNHPRRAGRMLPWSLVIVFALTGFLHWLHAAHFSFFLPPGINRRLIKAGIWVSIAAIIAFYTALLHSLQNRPYGPRSRIGMTLLAMLTIYVVVERREAFRPPTSLAPRPSIIEPAERPNLLVVGLEGATLDAVLPLSEQGQLPFLTDTLERGGSARLQTLEPTRRTALWISLATGKHPFRHGVLSDTTYSAPFVDTGAELSLIPVGLRFADWGVTDAARNPNTRVPRAVTLWEISSRLGRQSAVVSWPSVQRSPEISGSRGDATSVDGLFGTLPLADRRELARWLVSDQSIAQTAIDWIDGEPGQPSPDATFLVLPGLAQVSKRHFGGYSAVQFDGSQRDDDVRSEERLRAYYVFIDQLLGELWQRLPEPRLLAVVSAYGTRPADGLERLRAAVWRRRSQLGFTSGAPDGLLLLRGDGIEPGRFLSNAHITDVVPTLLYAMGFPVARDFDGGVLTTAFTDSFLAGNPLTFVPSYQTLTAPASQPTPSAGASAR